MRQTEELSTHWQNVQKTRWSRNMVIPFQTEGKGTGYGCPSSTPMAWSWRGQQTPRVATIGIECPRRPPKIARARGDRNKLNWRSWTIIIAQGIKGRISDRISSLLLSSAFVTGSGEGVSHLSPLFQLLHFFLYPGSN